MSISAENRQSMKMEKTKTKREDKSEQTEKKHKTEDNSKKPAGIDKNAVFAALAIFLIIGLYFLSQFVVGQSNLTDGIPKETDAPYETSYTDGGADGYSFGKCLIDQGAIYYGSDTCPYCNQQRDLFADDTNIPYVDCEKNYENRQKCIEEGIKLYPTWKIEGKEDLYGVQSLETLSDITGCELD